MVLAGCDGGGIERFAIKPHFANSEKALSVEGLAVVPGARSPDRNGYKAVL
jgi:hypothetical protein